MLTPVDIQQKKFRIGLGYEKKDVNDFFEQVFKDFEKLYRSNAELKEEVALLNDNLQIYKSKEKELEKSKLLAEKDSEDTKSRANKEAKNIELDAKNKAKVIIGDAEERLVKIKDEIGELESKYAAYKSEFATLLKKQFEFLGEIDFDVDSKIDEKYMAIISQATTVNVPAASSGDFGTFNGDPQMRDESTLGGMSGGASSAAYSGDAKSSDSSVYTSNLGANENFVDPFDPSSNTRFNPFSDEESKPKKTTQSNFKVSGASNRTRVRRTPAQSTKPKEETKDVPTIPES